MTEDDRNSLISKGIDLLKRRRYEEALAAFEKATALTPDNGRSIIGKSNTLRRIGNHDEAIQCWNRAHKIIKKNGGGDADVATLVLAGEIAYFYNNFLDATWYSVKSMEKDGTSIVAICLQGKVNIANKKYSDAFACFERAMSVEMGNVQHGLWACYSKYLDVEYCQNKDDRKSQEEIQWILRILDKTNEIAKKSEPKSEIRATILYFLAFFHFKSGDIRIAKRRLAECLGIKLDSALNKSVRSVVSGIERDLGRFSLLDWWWDSILLRRTRRVIFTVAVFLTLISAIVLLSGVQVQDPWCDFAGHSTPWVIVVTLLPILLLSPRILSIKAKDIAIQLHSPPPCDFVINPISFEKQISSLGTLPRRVASQPKMEI